VIQIYATVKSLAAWLASSLNLATKEDLRMTEEAVNAVKAEFESYQSDVKAKIGGLESTVTAMQSQIDALKAAGNDTQALSDLLAEIKAAHAELNPPAPTPTDPAPASDTPAT